MTMVLTGKVLLLIYLLIDSTVAVPHTDDVLTAEQKAALDTQLSLINLGLSMRENLLIQQFTAAKIFVNSHN